MCDWKKRSFAWLMNRVSDSYERIVQRRKEALLGGLTGRVVEIGSGTGPNLAFIGGDAFWVGVEPNRHMDRYLQANARSAGMAARIVRSSSAALPFADGSVDVVLSTLVLCSVGPQLEASLAEIVRVLRPGGRFVFLEHVAAPRGTFLRRVQGWVRPLWERVADGCRPDRETDRWIAEAGFERLEMDRFRLNLPLVGPHVSGVAWKRGAGT